MDYTAVTVAVLPCYVLVRLDSAEEVLVAAPQSPAANLSKRVPFGAVWWNFAGLSHAGQLK